MAYVLIWCLRRWSVFLLLQSLVKYAWCHSELPLLLLISMDGFRWDYLRMAKQQGLETPTFDQLIANGVTIGEGGLKNVFITKTYPNHFTLVTGLYPENHGIVGNVFFDQKFNESFDPGKVSSQDRKWWDGESAENRKGVLEPIWITNDQQGGGRASGSYMWPGGLVDNQQSYYTRIRIDKSDIDVSDAVQTIVGWFMDDLKPINLGVLYFNHADHVGHHEGAGSMKVLEIVVMLDGALQQLMNSLKSHKLLERMNIIVTSDHGMANITDWIYLDEFIDPSLYTKQGQSPVWTITPLKGKEEEVYNKLRTVPNMTVYEKSDIPDDLHFRNNRRVDPILVMASEGYGLCPDHNSSGCELKGDHGYSSSLPSMHPIFIAHGPAFKKNYTSQPFNNVDLYPLMCHILRISPHPNDGSLENIKHVLFDDGKGGATNTFSLSILIAIGFAAFISVITCIATFRSYWIYKRNKGQFFRLLNPSSLDAVEKEEENKHPLLASDEEDFV